MDPLKLVKRPGAGPGLVGCFATAPQKLRARAARPDLALTLGLDAPGCFIGNAQPKPRQHVCWCTITCCRPLPIIKYATERPRSPDTDRHPAKRFRPSMFFCTRSWTKAQHLTWETSWKPARQDAAGL